MSEISKAENLIRATTAAALNSVSGDVGNVGNVFQFGRTKKSRTRTKKSRAKTKKSRTRTKKSRTKKKIR